jgi:hypothetical protein
MKYSLSFEYNHNIKKVWKAVKDIRILGKIDPNINIEVNFLKGSCSWNKGSIYTLTSLNSYQAIVEVIQVIENQEFKLIKFKNKVLLPFNHEYINTVSLYYDTIQSSTKIVHEMLYEENTDVEFIKMMNVLRAEFLKKINDYLTYSNEYFSQEESFVLEINRKCLWEIVSNWNILKKLVPFIADLVIYEGSPKVKGTNLRLKWLKKNIECFLKVERVSNEIDNDVWEYSLLCYKGVPAVPEQEIIFKILRIDKNFSFLEFKHVFKQSIKNEILESISQDKKKILQTLKEKIDKMKQNVKN